MSMISKGGLPTRLFAELSFFPRVSKYDGRAIEAALAGPNLFEQPVSLHGAVIEATFAASDPPLLARLREGQVARVIDPQALRFTTETFLDIPALSELAYAPDRPIRPGSHSEAELRDFVRSAFLFQQQHHASAYLVPGLPIADDDVQGWLALNGDVHRIAADLNGRGVIERRELVGLLAPGRRSLADPGALVTLIADLPVSAVYAQPLRLRPTHDGVEKLVQYTRFLDALADLDIPVVAGRVGAFGLLLQALGVAAFFDCGLGDAESFELAALNRPKPRNSPGKGSAGRNRRVYLAELKTTLQSRHAEAILREPGLRGRFTCELGCCRFSGLADLVDRRRQHYLRVRQHEVAEVARLPSRSSRLEVLHGNLLEAREHGLVVARTLRARGVDPPSFEHLDRWLGVLSRTAETLVPAV
jgi:hypothetical protein